MAIPCIKICEEHLQKFRVIICKNLRYEDLFLSHLVQNAVIDHQQKDELDTIEIRHRRTGRLLDMIHQGCTAARAMAFVTTLKQTGQFHIAKVAEYGGKFPSYHLLHLSTNPKNAKFSCG